MSKERTQQREARAAKKTVLLRADVSMESVYGPRRKETKLALKQTLDSILEVDVKVHVSSPERPRKRQQQWKAPVRLDLTFVLEDRDKFLAA